MTELLSENPLFTGIAPCHIKKLLEALSSKEKTYKKGHVIFRCGEITDSLGIVLEGGVIIEHNDLWGNRNIIGTAEKGTIFGEAYSCLKGVPLLIEVSASENTRVLFLNIQKLLSCENTGPAENMLIKNLLTITAGKNVSLSRRILYTSPKTIRGRLMTYLSDLSKQSGSLEVTVPFSRQMMADYLEVDRSALSNELSKMQSEGLMTFRKNIFRLNEEEFYI